MLNLELLKHPYNWIIVSVMALMGFALLALVAPEGDDAS